MKSTILDIKTRVPHDCMQVALMVLMRNVLLQSGASVGLLFEMVRNIKIVYRKSVKGVEKSKTPKECPF